MIYSALPQAVLFFGFFIDLSVEWSYWILPYFQYLYRKIVEVIIFSEETESVADVDKLQEYMNHIVCLLLIFASSYSNYSDIGCLP